jgi:hypothetical protein
VLLHGQVFPLIYVDGRYSSVAPICCRR